MVGIVGSLAMICSVLCFSLARASTSTATIGVLPPVTYFRYIPALGAIVIGAAAFSLVYLLAVPWFQRPATMLLQSENFMPAPDTLGTPRCRT
jgi:hypothetical protein